MEWSVVYELVLAAKVPLFAAVVGGFLGAGCTLLGTHYLTQKREREKLLRDKGEALLFLVLEMQHRLTVWQNALWNQARQPTATLIECPIDIARDIEQAHTLQQLYFPSVDLEAYVDALIPYFGWLEAEWSQHRDDPEAWRDEVRWADGHALRDAYEDACRATLQAIANAVPRSGNLAAVLGRPFRSLKRFYDDL